MMVRPTYSLWQRKQLCRLANERLTLDEYERRKSQILASEYPQTAPLDSCPKHYANSPERLKLEQAILEHLRIHNKLSTSEISALTGVNIEPLRKQVLRRMKRAGLIKSKTLGAIGGGQKTFWWAL